MRLSLSVTLLCASFVYGVALTGIPSRNHWSDPYSLRPNPLYPYTPSRPPATAKSPGKASAYAPRFWKDSDVSPSRTRRSTKFRAGTLPVQPRQGPYTATERGLDTRPTPEPTGKPSDQTTVFISSANDFALLLPATPGGTFKKFFFFRFGHVGSRRSVTFYQSSYPTRKWMQTCSALLEAVVTSARTGCPTVSSPLPPSRKRMTDRGSRYFADAPLAN